MLKAGNLGEEDTDAISILLQLSESLKLFQDK
jgi:hypothetical protein